MVHASSAYSEQSQHQLEHQLEHQRLKSDHRMCED